MQKYYKMCKMEITDLIKGMESANVSDIYIFLHEDGPVAFDASAAHLLCYFPEMEMESVFCSDSKRHRIIQGFALEPVLERLAQYPCLVDDDCIRIMGVL